MAACPSCGEENKEGARFCNACGAPLRAAVTPATEVRKTVTVLFSDVTGSTALGEQHDPESMRRVMGRYFEEMRTVIERHGGTVEKFIGDAVMAIFGIPQLHEDDGLRALRAAIEMRERLVSLNEELGRDFGTTLQVRTGVNTGEVVAGTGETLATGDAVNVAARLEQAAQPGEILIGETTYRLVRDAVDAEPLEPVAAKGKSEPLSAFRLEALVAGAEPFARRLEGPLVGRERELALLHDAYKRAVEGQSCHLFTLLGTAGIGKSRLAQELLAAVGQEVTALSGRCLPYGEGITYWPLVEILEQLGSETAVVQLLEGAPDARSIVNQVFAAVGLAETAGTGEETFWAIRRLFEALARERPLVLVLDDVQWAEPTFLDLVEHVADLSRDAPILLLCLARPELLDERSSWGGGKLNATSILLEPLSEEAAGELIERLLTHVALPQRTRDRIAEAAEGNPLFVEQMIAMLAEEGGAEEEVAVPPTIHALLAARLDRLPPDERALIERAAVVGKEFWRAAIEHLAPDLTELARPLQQLVRKELIRAARSTIFPGEDAFRFRHLLIRDVAYAGMPKELRAELHERFADWLEGQVSGYDEIVGYHLEQAYRYRAELGPPDARTRKLAARASGHLGAAGIRASTRADQTAAANLLERAVSLLPPDSRERLELLPELGRAWIERGELERAGAVLDEAHEQAQNLGDTTAAARVATMRIETDLLTVSITMEEGLAQAKRAAGVFEEASDELGLAQAWHLVGRLMFWLGRSAAAEEAWEDAVAYARRAGGRREEASTLGWLSIALMIGPTPVEQALRRIEEILEEAGDLRMATAQALICRGMLEAMHERFDEGRAATEQGRAIYEDLGARVNWASSGMVPGELELLAGDVVAAERTLRPACEALHAMGDRGYLSSASADLAEALYRQGRLDEADEWAHMSQESAAPDDFEAQFHWRAVRGRILARRGDIAEGERLAREALAIVEPTDWPTRRGQALIALSEILDLAGRPKEAAEAAEQAVQRFDAKGDVASVRSARELLQEIHARVS